MKCDEVKIIFLPFYKTLKVECIMQTAFTFPELEPYWPHEKDLPRIGRSWLSNMIYTVVGPRF